MNKISHTTTGFVRKTLRLFFIGVLLTTLIQESSIAQEQNLHANEGQRHEHLEIHSQGVHNQLSLEGQFLVGSRIYFGENGASLIKVDLTTWAELRADDKLAFIFDETSRDANSIVLKDAERPGVVLTIDIAGKVVKHNGAVLGWITRITHGKGALRNEKVDGELRRRQKYSITFHNESDRSVFVHAAKPAEKSTNGRTILGQTDNHLIAPRSVAPKSSLTMTNLPSGSQFRLEDPLLGFTNHELGELAVRLTYAGNGSFRAHEARNYSNGGNPEVLGLPQSVPKPETLSQTPAKGNATYTITYINRTQSKVPFRLIRYAMVGTWSPGDHVVEPEKTKHQTFRVDRLSFQAVLEVNGRTYPVDFKKANGTVVIDAYGVTYDGVSIQPYTYGPQTQPQYLPNQLTTNQPKSNQLIPRLGFWFKPAYGGLYVEAVEVGSKAQNIGMQPGQTITAFNGVAIQSEQAYRDQMKLAVAGNGQIRLTVRADNGFEAQLETSVKDR